MIEKTYISPRELLHDSFTLARQIFDSGFRPDILIVLWRGGTPVGIAVHEFLLYKGVSTYHTVLKAESYAGIEKRTAVRLEHAETLLDIIRTDDKVLVIDDIFDSGCTIREIRNLIRVKTPHLKVATLYYKEDNNRTELCPDYYVRKTDHWVVFPHELMDLSLEEIKSKDPFTYDLLTG